MCMLTEYQNLVDGDCNESAIQTFLEEHTELIPTPYLLGHQLHCDAIITKFPIDTSLITDYAYMTKQSDRWNIVLVELEQPNKAFFTANRDVLKTSSHLEIAMSQIRDWQDFVDRETSHVINKLAPLMGAMSHNPVEFKYVLIYGRRNELNDSKKIQRVNRLVKQLGCEILTYDSLVSRYNAGGATTKQVLALEKDRYRIKRMRLPLNHILDILTPSRLSLTDEQKDLLARNKYDIGSWEKK